MSLPDVDDLKAYLRIEHDADDALLERLLAAALAVVTAELDRPLEAEEQVFVLEAPEARQGGLVAESRRAPGLRIPVTPVAPDPAPTVVDADGLTLPADALRLNPATGVLTPLGTTRLDRWPYTATATVGLGTRADYDRVVAPALGAVVVDLAGDAYQRRNPNAAAEGAGGGVYTQYAQGQLGLPPRAREVLCRFRRVTA